MKALMMTIGDGTYVELDPNRPADSDITLHDGPIVGSLERPLGDFDVGTRFYGNVWTAGPQVVIRFYEARSPRWGTLSICLVARGVGPQLRKLPGSKPGTAVIIGGLTPVWVVDAFR